MTGPSPSGLVIGKFMPPHAGHLRLLALARALVTTRLHIILFSKANESIPGDLRAAWLAELAPWAEVHHVRLEHRVDFADPAAWDFWIEAIRQVLPAMPAEVFSSEDYGDELAQRLGARHWLVDRDRVEAPISGTQIRADPMAHWDYIPPPVRPYFVRRIAIIGAESTGKTTLAEALAGRLATVCVPEYAREYLLARGGQCTAEDMPVIAQGQAALEDDLARRANRLLVCDTDLITTQLWHERYFGRCTAELMKQVEARPAHLYLLCGLDVPWAADGLRDSPGYREWFYRRFLEELDRRGLAYRIVSGSWERRLEDAVAAAEALLR